jgi:hypothetical protein
MTGRQNDPREVPIRNGLTMGSSFRTYGALGQRPSEENKNIGPAVTKFKSLSFEA